MNVISQVSAMQIQEIVKGEGRRRSGHDCAVLDTLDAERREHGRQREGRAQRA